jgi:hypothetical protein
MIAAVGVLTVLVAVFVWAAIAGFAVALAAAAKRGDARRAALVADAFGSEPATHERRLDPGAPAEPEPPWNDPLAAES